MTYEEYQNALTANQNAIAKACEAESKKRQELVNNYRQRQKEAKDNYLQTLKLIDQLYHQEKRNNHEYWEAERSRLNREMRLTSYEWKVQNGILPSANVDGKQGKEVSDGDRQE